MRRGTDGILHPGLGDRSQTFPGTGRAANTGRLASVAALTMARQTPGLVLPVLSNVPTSFAHTEGGDTAVALAASLVELGLGSVELWQRHHGNPSLFVRGALNEWLQSLGAAELEQHVSLDFAIVDDLDGVHPEQRKLFILLETSDGCGFLAVGKALERLEQEEAGLGRSFYIVLDRTMNRWMYVYDAATTESYLDQWKESIEMDIDGWDGSPEAFERHCKETDVNVPDFAAATPVCVREINVHKECRRMGRHLVRLRKHRCGPCAELIEPVLTLAAAPKPQQGLNIQEIEGGWDDQPLPNWMVAFEAYDPITQAFDEERQHMYECSHAPTWVDSFDPSDANDVRRVLLHVQNMVRVNRSLVDLAIALERSYDLASTDQPQFHPELRAA